MQKLSQSSRWKKTVCIYVAVTDKFNLNTGSEFNILVSFLFKMVSHKKNDIFSKTGNKSRLLIGKY